MSRSFGARSEMNAANLFTPSGGGTTSSPGRRAGRTRSSQLAVRSQDASRKPEVCGCQKRCCAPAVVRAHRPIRSALQGLFFSKWLILMMIFFQQKYKHRTTVADDACSYRG